MKKANIFKAIVLTPVFIWMAVIVATNIDFGKEIYRIDYLHEVPKN